MKKICALVYASLVCLLFIVLPGCYKDKGNYDYNMPEEPVITGLDSVYNVLVGDSLIIAPKIEIKSASSLSYEWRIGTPDPKLEDVVDSGSAMRVIFGLQAERYYGKLTVINNDNGMKYFRSFIVSGQTDFFKGTTVLSVENGETHVSFIKMDGSVQARLYGAVNPNTPLPTAPTQLVALPEAYRPGTVKTYWVFGKNGVNTGVRIDANTFRSDRVLKEHFFDAPETITASNMFASSFGVLVGVVNDKLIAGESRTWDQAPIFGMFPLPAPGDYTLSSEIIYTDALLDGYYSFTGFDKVKKQFVRLGIPGDATYYGTAYDVLGTAFDPKNLGADIFKMLKIRGGIGYAYSKTETGTFEYKFNAQFNPGNSGTQQITFNAMRKRAFMRPELIKPNTLWAANTSEIIFFSSGDRIYRYNPENEDFRELATTFNGKEITMLKVSGAIGDTLIVGVEGSIYYLNVGVGANGELVKKTDGIPGAPIDIATR